MDIVYLAGYFDGWGTYCASLESLGTHEIFIDRIDKFPLSLDAVRRRQPEMIVYCGLNGGPCKPEDKALRGLRDIAPTVMICPEASDPVWWHRLVADYTAAETFDLIVNIDGNRDWPGSERGLTLLMPVDPMPWAEPIGWQYRYVRCGFSGGNSNPARSSMLMQLADLVTWRGPDPDADAAKTYHGYRDFMKQTKIAFNMALHGTVNEYREYNMHVKGRVTEAGLAGCALVEAKSPTAAWFRPGADYLEYDSVAMARAQILRLMADEGLAAAMGESLRRRVLSEHSPKQFWDRVIAETFARAKATPVGAAAYG